MSQPRKRKRGRASASTAPHTGSASTTAQPSQPVTDTLGVAAVSATATVPAPAPTNPRGSQPAGAGRPRRAKREPVTNKEWMERYAERGEARNAAAREQLVPLAPGERPWPILTAIVLCTAFALLNVVLWAIGAKIDGKAPGTFEMLAFALLMGICSVGMWVLWYQAVLAFMVLLAIVVCLFALLLVEVSNITGLVLSLLIVSGGGYLFWKLVRVLARLQMPERPTRAARG